MTTHSPQLDTERAAGASAAGAQTTAVAAARWVPLLAGALATIPVLLTLGAQPMFRDEAATLYAARLPAADLVAMLRKTDGIFALYYALVHPLVAVGSLTAARLLSVSAYGVTVALMGVMGRRVGGTAGLFAGAITTAVNPLLVMQAHSARPYALATCALTGGLLLLTRPTEDGRDARDGARPRAVGWVLLVVASYLHLFALVAVVCATAALILGGPAPARRARLRQAVLAAAAVLPVVVVGMTQRAQVSWLPRPTARGAFDIVTAPLYTLPWVPSGAVGKALVDVAPVLAVALVVALVAVGLRRGRDRRPLVVTGASWLVGPGLILVCASALSPVASRNYVTFSAPALGLLAAVAVGSGRRVAGRIVAPLLVLTCLAATTVGLRPAPYVDDFAGAAAYLQSNAAGEDVVVYPSSMARTGVTEYLTREVRQWPSSGEVDLQRWNIDTSWRPPRGAGVWIADFPSPFDGEGLGALTDALRADGYREVEERRFSEVFVRHLVAPGR